MATISKLPSGRWRAQVRKTGYPIQTKTCDSKAEASQWAKGVERDMESNTFSKAREVRAIKVSEVAQRYLDEVLVPRSRSEATRMRTFMRTQAWMAKKLSDVTPEDIKRFRDVRVEQVTKATVAREMNILAGMFTHAMKEWGYTLPNNPVRLVKKPPNPDVRRSRRWTDEEIEAFKAHTGFNIEVPPTQGRQYVCWALLLGLETAMRLGEITAIKVSDYRREKDEVKLWRTKNGDERSVPLSTRAKELLDKLVLGKGRDDQIFPFSSEVLGTFFRRVRGELGFTDLHFHDMRHEAITRMAEKFDNLLQLSKVSGHRDMKHLARYYNPSASELAARLG